MITPNYTKAHHANDGATQHDPSSVHSIESRSQGLGAEEAERTSFCSRPNCLELALSLSKADSGLGSDGDGIGWEEMDPRD